MKYPSVAALVGLVLLGGCGGSSTPKPTPRKPPSAAVSVEGAPLKFAMIGYFNDHCSTCHGQFGDQLAQIGDSVHTIGPDEYRGVVTYMVTGPSQAELPEHEIGALTAYCRAVMLKKPYAAMIEPTDSRNGLEGEMTPGGSAGGGTGTTVRLVADQTTINATVEGFRWSIPKRELEAAKQQAGAKWTDARIEININGSVITLPLSAAYLGPEHPFKPKPKGEKTRSGYGRRHG